jgi:hypothetical protein
MLTYVYSLRRTIRAAEMFVNVINGEKIEDNEVDYRCSAVNAKATDDGACRRRVEDVIKPRLPKPIHRRRPAN